MLFSKDNTYMIKHRIFITATTVAVIFFLTFLGMRLAFLDKSSKPKPKPRAVLNLSAKSASSTACSLKHIPVPAFDISHELSLHHIPTFLLVKQYINPTSDSFRLHHSSPPKDRAPPLS